MNKKPELILKDDGSPATALMTGMMARITAPANQAAWVYLQCHTEAHESEAVRDQLSEVLPPEIFQIALDPIQAHELGLYLIDQAKRAIEPR